MMTQFWDDHAKRGAKADKRAQKRAGRGAKAKRRAAHKRERKTKQAAYRRRKGLAL